MGSLAAVLGKENYFSNYEDIMKVLQKIKNARAEVSSVVKHFPNMHKALGLIPSTEKKQKK
jgi:hypothetical protein